mmetsp:Transcript_9467/g.23676  ORF Transcript_9467/g.23676 Transcript_9467/m.23676 type:complete len:209 (+) Transcript_9467:308-934(+)
MGTAVYVHSAVHAAGREDASPVIASLRGCNNEVIRAVARDVSKPHAIPKAGKRAVTLVRSGRDVLECGRQHRASAKKGGEGGGLHDAGLCPSVWDVCKRALHIHPRAAHSDVGLRGGRRTGSGGTTEPLELALTHKLKGWSKCAVHQRSGPQLPGTLYIGVLEPRTWVGVAPSQIWGADQQQRRGYVGRNADSVPEPLVVGLAVQLGA